MSSEKDKIIDIRTSISPYLNLVITGEVDLSGNDRKFPKPKFFAKLPDTLMDKVLLFLLHPISVAHLDGNSYNEEKINYIKRWTKGDKSVRSNKSLGKKFDEEFSEDIVVHRFPLKSRGRKITVKQGRAYMSVPLETLPRAVSEKKIKEMNEKKLGTKIESSFDLLRFEDSKYNMYDNDEDDVNYVIGNSEFEDFDFYGKWSDPVTIKKVNDMIYNSFNVLLMKEGDWIIILGFKGVEWYPPMFMWDGISVVYAEGVEENSRVPKIFTINRKSRLDYYGTMTKINDDCWLDLKRLKYKKISSIFNYNVFECTSTDDKNKKWIYLTRSINPMLDRSPALCYNQINIFRNTDESNKYDDESKKKVKNAMKKSLVEIKKYQTEIKEAKLSELKGIWRKMDDTEISYLARFFNYESGLLTSQMIIDPSQMVDNSDEYIVPVKNYSQGSIILKDKTETLRQYMISVLDIYRFIAELNIKYGYINVLLSIIDKNLELRFHHTKDDNRDFQFDYISILNEDEFENEKETYKKLVVLSKKYFVYPADEEVKESSDNKEEKEKLPIKKPVKKEESSDSEEEKKKPLKKVPAKKLVKKEESSDSEEEKKDSDRFKSKLKPLKKVPAKKSVKKEESSDSDAPATKKKNLIKKK